MPTPIHRYITQTKPKANVSIQKTNSHQPNINLQTFNAVINTSTGAEMEYRYLIKYPTTELVWNLSMANEFRRLAKGVVTITKQELEQLNS